MMSDPEFDRIVTHNDFDGIVSAALVSAALDVERVIFTGPNSIARAEISTGLRDIVCDLPYPLDCGMWFDHHSGNLDALKLRGIDPEGIPGRFAEQPSCARVVLEYFVEGGFEFPAHIAETVDETDMIDSFDYHSVAEWREETSGKLIDMSIKSDFRDFREQTRFLRRLAEMVGEMPLQDIAADEEVSARIENYRAGEEKMIRLIEDSVSFLEEDTGRELVVMDFTHHKRRPRVIRNLAYMLYPEALGAMTINSLFRRGTKTNDLSITISLSMNMTGRDHGKDMGEIMRSLDIGDGHTGAAAGTINCGSKDQMLREKKRALEEIWTMWKEMPAT
jgi:hypothetical protein